VLEKYLIWDFDGTLATRPGEWTATLCEVFSRRFPDRPLDPERIRPHMRRGFPWHTPESVREPCAADEWWDGLTPVFEAAFVAGADLAPAEARALAGEVRSAYLEPTLWTVYEDSIPVLEELAHAGWRHLMLSNHVPELGGIVARLGLQPYFGAVYCSADIGVEKPNPKAFERVLADYPAARAGWMIGDSWTADVQGATRVGLRSILVRRSHAEARLRCETLRDAARIVRGG
jgi:putative hydrolase of the HAD superfamily